MTPTTHFSQLGTSSFCTNLARDVWYASSGLPAATAVAPPKTDCLSLEDTHAKSYSSSSIAHGTDSRTDVRW